MNLVVSAILSVALSPSKFLHTNLRWSLTYLFETEKLSSCILSAIILDFSYKLLPSVGIPGACLVMFQASRLLSISQKVDCLPTFLYLQVLEHLWIFSQISIFFTTVKSDMSGANLMCSVVKLIERTKKMQLCSRIYYSIVSQLLNAFRVTRRPSSGAQKL